MLILDLTTSLQIDRIKRRLRVALFLSLNCILRQYGNAGVHEPLLSLVCAIDLAATHINPRSLHAQVVAQSKFLALAAAFNDLCL